MLWITCKLPPNRLAVRTWPHPEASVLQIGVIQRQPETKTSLVGLCEEKGGVLVRCHLPPNPCLLEYIHRLGDDGIYPAQLANKRSDFSRNRIVVECPRADVHSVSGLIQRRDLVASELLAEFPVLVNRVLLCEKVNPISAVEEIVVRPLGLDLPLISPEHTRLPLLSRIPKFFSETPHLVLHFLDHLGGDESPHVEESISVKVTRPVGGAPQRRRRCGQRKHRFSDP
mmetsp:Transcript_20917/g.42206  ORF Transcript_20917/g.42206 Transcript_20917/m.42206 type:complete len:228 (+) Transcript_20917:352-1035(+)